MGRKRTGTDIAIHAVRRVASVRLRDRPGLVGVQRFTVLPGQAHDLRGAGSLEK